MDKLHSENISPTSLECEKLTQSTEIKEFHTIDEAVQLAGHGKFQLILIIIVGISTMQILLEGQCMGVVLPSAKCELNLTTQEQGVLSSITFFGIVIASQLWGVTVDTWGRKKTLQLTLIMAFTSSVLSSFATKSWMLLISRCIVGISISGVKLSCIAYLGEFILDKYRAKYFTILASFVASGQIIEGLLALLIIPLKFEFIIFSNFIYKPWRLYILIGNVISGFSMVATWFLPEGPKFTLAMGRDEECLEILKTVYKINTGNDKKSFPVKKIIAEKSQNSNIKNIKGPIDALRLLWIQTWPLFSTSNRLYLILMSILSFCIYAVTQTFQIWYAQILAYYTDNKSQSLTTCQAISIGHQTHLNKIALFKDVINHANSSEFSSLHSQCNNITINPVTYQVILGLGIFCVVVSVIVGLAMVKVGKRVMLTSWIFIGSISSLILIWNTEFYTNTIFMVFLISNISMINVLINICGDFFPAKFKGMAISLILMMGRIGSVTGINIAAIMLFNNCTGLFGLGFGVLMFCTMGTFYILGKLPSAVQMMNDVEQSSGGKCGDVNEDDNDDDDAGVETNLNDIK